MPFPILGTPKPAFFDSSGSPLVSGTLTIKDPTADTNKASYPTYDDAVALTNAHTNPITLDSRGETTTEFWGLDGEDYKLVLKDSAGNTIWTVDPVNVPIALPYGITAAETAAGVTPTNYSYPPGDLRRYGADETGAVASTTEINSALSVGGIVTGMGFPYKIAGTLNIAVDGTVFRDFKVTGEQVDGRAFYVTADNVVIESFTIDGGYVSGAQGTAMTDGIYAYQTDGMTVRHGVIKGFYGDTDNDLTAGLAFVESTNWYAHDIDFENIGVANTEAYAFSARGVNTSPSSDGRFHGFRMDDINTGVHLSSVERVRGSDIKIKTASDNGVYLTNVIERVELSDFLIEAATEGVVLRSFYDSDPPNETYLEQPETKATLSDFTIIGATNKAVALRQGGGYVLDNFHIIGCVDGIATSTSFTDGVENSQFRGFSIINTTSHPVFLGSTVNCDGLDFFDLYIRGGGEDGLVTIGTNPNNIRFWNPVMLVDGGSATKGISIGTTPAAGRRIVAQNVWSDATTPVSYNAADAVAFSLVNKEVSPTTFTAADATPSVLLNDVFLTDTGGLTITDFDDGYSGKEITVISKGAITYDTTGTNLNGSSVDIVTAAGDVTRWVCEDGTDWRLIGFVDTSVDNSGGA